MISYILLAIVKILDNLILTAKSIATYQNKKILSSLLIIVSQFIFYFVITEVVNDSTMTAIIVISISSGIGNYLAFVLNEKFKKDDVWGNVITSSDSEMLIDLCAMLRQNRIKYLLMDTYNRKFERHIRCKHIQRQKRRAS